ncbi:hypothetical protein GVX82_02130 [Patescibacteria group bacterium]|jgi:hypothetical protein|nr:hypothetical protein [Patescibacteria group bacterium]
MHEQHDHDGGGQSPEVSDHDTYAEGGEHGAEQPPREHGLEPHPDHQVSDQTRTAVSSASYESWSLSLGDAFSVAWGVISTHPFQIFIQALGFTILYAAVIALLQAGVAIVGLSLDEVHMTLVAVLAMAGTFLVGVWFTLALYRWILEIVAGGPPRFGAFFETAHYGTMAGVIGLNALTTLGGVILLIVPGILLSLRHFFALFAVFHTEGIGQAFTTSAHMTHGNRLRLFFYLLAVLALGMAVYVAFTLALAALLLGGAVAGAPAVALIAVPFLLVGGLVVMYVYLFIFMVWAALYRQALSRPRPPQSIEEQHERRTSILLWIFGGIGAVVFGLNIAIGIFTGNLAQDDSVFSNLREAQENAERAQEVREEARREMEAALDEAEQELAPEEAAEVEAMFEQMLEDAEQEARVNTRSQSASVGASTPGDYLYNALVALVGDLRQASQAASALLAPAND